MVLIKSILSTLPIFQFSSLLAPKGILKDLAQLIHKFLWQGGKSNHKKIHLVNWDTITLPKKSGGLEIKDPEVTNIAMGAKILWRIVTREKEWWKMALIKKYRMGGRKRCMDKTLDPQPGWKIWKLIRIVIPLFKEHLSWIPRNGKMIRLWQDPIMGVDLNSCEEETCDLKRWMLDEYKHTLYYNLAWNENGNWKEWNSGVIPDHVISQA